MVQQLVEQFPVNGLTAFFRSIVPEPQDRHPWTVWGLPQFALSYIPFFLLAYLSRRPGTYVVRILLFPVVSILILRASFGHFWTIPSLNVYNWGQCLFAEVTLGKALEYAFTAEGMLKVGEIRAGEESDRSTNTVGNGSPHHFSNGHANGHVSPPEIQVQFCSIVPQWFFDATDLMFSLRGSRYKFGAGLHIPKHTRPLQRRSFLKSTLISFIQNFLLLDFLESVIKLFPGVGDVSGGSMYYQDLLPFPRYAIATFIHTLTGSALLAGFGMVYDLITLIAVGVFNSPTSRWPPVVDHPWSSESLHELWAKRWHQLLRQTFIVYGGIPGLWLGGNIGALFGTFIASGLFHEVAIYAMARGFEWAPLVFFSMQAFLLILERIWRKVTGRRVGGWYGRLWVYLDMFVLAQPMVNSWHRRGLGGAMIIPPFISPARFLLPPVLTFLNSILLRR